MRGQQGFEWIARGDLLRSWERRALRRSLLRLHLDPPSPPPAPRLESVSAGTLRGGERAAEYKASAARRAAPHHNQSCNPEWSDKALSKWRIPLHAGCCGRMSNTTPPPCLLWPGNLICAAALINGWKLRDTAAWRRGFGDDVRAFVFGWGSRGVGVAP